MPAQFDLGGVLLLGLQVLGLTYDHLRPQLVKRVGEPAVDTLEKGAGLLTTLATQGPRAAGKQLLALGADLAEQVRAQVSEGLRTWVAKTLLGRLAAELLQLLSPVGAVFSAIEKTYTTLVFFLEKAHRLQAVLTTLVDSLLPIALGQTGPAAAKVEAELGARCRGPACGAPARQGHENGRQADWRQSGPTTQRRFPFTAHCWQRMSN